MHTLHPATPFPSLQAKTSVIWSLYDLLADEHGMLQYTIMACQRNVSTAMHDLCCHTLPFVHIIALEPDFAAHDDTNLVWQVVGQWFAYGELTACTSCHGLGFRPKP